MEFVRELPDIVVTQAPSEDEPIVFECELSRPPRDNVKWTKNGKEIPKETPSHMHIMEEKKSTIHRLVFDKVEDDDLGEYTISAEDKLSKGKLQMKGKQQSSK